MKKTIAVAAVIFSMIATANAANFYHKEHLELEPAWQFTKGANVKIAVLNTGLNYRLDEFIGKVEKDPSNDSYGYDATTDTFDPLDDLGLGTQEASLVVGASFGVAPEAKIIPIRIFDRNGTSSQLVIAKGIDYAIKRGVQIILLAIGTNQTSTVICEALRQAAQANILVVAAAGNSAQELTTADYPTVCGVSNVVVVTASDEARKLASYSSYSFKHVHTAAPGEFIPSLDYTNQQVDVRGSSASAALAAGVAALVWSHNPNYTPLQVKEALIKGATSASDLLGKVSSNGILSAYKAMEARVD